jgi:hypothetical protein
MANLHLILYLVRGGMGSYFVLDVLDKIVAAGTIGGGTAGGDVGADGGAETWTCEIIQV